MAKKQTQTKTEMHVVIAEKISGLITAAENELNVKKYVQFTNEKEEWWYISATKQKSKFKLSLRLNEQKHMENASVKEKLDCFLQMLEASESLSKPKKMKNVFFNF